LHFYIPGCLEALNGEFKIVWNFYLNFNWLIKVVIMVLNDWVDGWVNKLIDSSVCIDLWHFFLRPNRLQLNRT